MPYRYPNILVPTGQTVSYASGDDGAYEAGWHRGLRFISKILNGNPVIIDRATNLMWAAEVLSETYWGNQFSIITAKNWAGFLDWKMPNLMELLSLINFGSGAYEHVYPAFGFLGFYTFWTSTTSGLMTTQAYALMFGMPASYSLYDKITHNHRGIYCRSIG